MLWLTRDQIAAFVARVGQPRASVLLHDFFNQYCSTLDSVDVAPIYDDEFFRHVADHPVHTLVAGRYKVNVYNGFTYDYLRPRLKAESRVLDIGCGLGDFALAVASHGVHLVWGIDSSPVAITTAKQRLTESGFANCQFGLQALTDLARDMRFDFVILNDVTEHLSDRELTRLFADLDPLLAQGAQVVIHTPNGLSIASETDRSWLQDLYKGYLRLTRGWQGYERGVQQLYFEQAHINVKSYRQLHRFLGQFGYATRVQYDDKRLKGLPFTEQLSGNMLVIAQKAH